MVDSTPFYERLFYDITVVMVYQFRWGLGDKKKK